MKKVKVGDVLWRMRGHKKAEDLPVEWHPVPICVEYVDDRKFLDAWSCGGSLGLIGVTYFWTRRECLEDYNRHKYKNYVPPQPPPKVKPGSLVPDSKEISFDDTFVHVFSGVEWKKVPSSDIPWKTASYGAEEFHYATLGEIRDAVKAKTNSGFITVVVEDGMHGEIYQTGNYSGETQFRLHGETMGYW